MVTTVIGKNTIEITDTSIATLPRSPVILPGTEFLFDFTDPYCNPNADGALAHGSAFVNMVDGKPAAVINGAGFSSVAGRAGLACLAGTPASNSVVELGDNYDHAVDLHPFVRNITFKVPATGYSTDAYVALFQHTDTNNNLAQWIFDMGPAGLRPRAGVGNATGPVGSRQSFMGADIAPGAIVHLGLHWAPGQVTLYQNGVAAATVASANINTLINPTQPIKLLGKMKFTAYKLMGEDLTVSGRTASAAIATDYADTVAKGYV